ncbi:hypothetical protein EVAR_83408_1 [Eumeta japonica]|uniref:Uncharacterized protein n=1 Tax=Eumeta variegata TaxID=151549 RepID=A0A4C1TYG6_EUMVA|nr:hypothetical protein EVAR_83408_1 [Eumeta japonica]
MKEYAGKTGYKETYITEIIPRGIYPPPAAAAEGSAFGQTSVWAIESRWSPPPTNIYNRSGHQHLCGRKLWAAYGSRTSAIKMMLMVFPVSVAMTEISGGDSRG